MNRDKLLAPQLSKSDVWVDLANKIDQVFTQLGIDDARTKLALLRAPLNLRDVVSVTPNGDLIALDSVERHERATLIQTANMIGFRFHHQNLLNTEDYLRLCMYLGQYYDEDKGTERFIEFMSYICNAIFELHTTWTRDYVHFLKEGDPLIGTPVYEGGEWYPTTHVILKYDFVRFSGVTVFNLIEFFNYFANINVVLWSIEMVGDTFLQAKITGAAMHEIWY